MPVRPFYLIFLHMEFSSILISRTDRLGDLVLTIPLATSIKMKNRSLQVAFLVRKYQAPLLFNHPDVDEILLFDGNFESSLRKFDVFIDVFPRFETALRAFRARVPVRIGTAYRLWSFLYNRRVRVHRRPSVLHEYEYNFKLLEPLGNFEIVKPRLYVSEDERKIAVELLEEFKRPIVALHPTGGRSGPDVRMDVYLEITKFLKNEGVSVIHIGDKRAEFLPVDRDFGGETDLRTLMAILKEIDLLISPSTGPMHIANALETPTLAFFKGTGSSRPTRWGPLCEKSRVIIGDFDEKEKILHVDLDEVLKEIRELLM